MSIRKQQPREQLARLQNIADTPPNAQQIEPGTTGSSAAELAMALTNLHTRVLILLEHDAAILAPKHGLHRNDIIQEILKRLRV